MNNRKIIFIICLVLVSFLYLFLRLNKIEELIGFRLDQGIHLLETKAMFDSKKIRLVGPMVTSKSFMGRNFFIGANYYYVLGIVGLIGQWNPMTITIIFILLEFIFYLFFIFFLKYKFNSFWALIIFGFITISPYLIIHSRFFWNPHLLIPLSILVLLLSEKYFLKKQLKYLFLMAFCWGFAFASHYSAVFWGLFFLLVIIKNKSYLNIKTYLSIIFGFLLGNLPFFIFEIRHGFYNIKTLWYVFINSSSGGDVTSHYFIFPLLIFLIFGLLFLISIIKNKIGGNILLIVLMSGLYLLQFKFFNNYAPLDVIPEWNYGQQQKVADLIVKNGCPKNFEVAATVQGDTRAYDLRYLLNLRNCEPMEVEEYPRAERLFLVAPINRPPETETVWEVTSLGKFKINQQEKLNSNIVLYELEKK
ncbi:MAG: hypothetical protein PHH12_02380 [Candidatus Shapirobacteria bacterium]|nr:hypothetical protein [Candidatus Shapirobacteria bacterium]